MEKKNINIVGVRNCTILLLTVFTIGRKYGQEQKATDLINDLRQQPCACCLNFEKGDALAQAIDGKKGELEEQKNQLEEQKNNLQNEKNQLQGDKNFLQNQIDDLRNEKNQLREQNGNLANEKEELKKQKEQLRIEIQIKNNEIDEFKNNINYKKGAKEIAEKVQEPLNNLNNNLNNYNKLNLNLTQQIQTITIEKTELNSKLQKNIIELQEKDKTFNEVKRQIEQNKIIKEQLEKEKKKKKRN